MTTDAVGGVWQYSVDLVCELALAGIDVTLVCFGPAPTRQQQQQVQGIRGCELIAAPFALEWQQNPWESIERARTWLLTLACEVKPDVVHLNGYALAEGDWKVPVLCVAHSCVFSWWHAVHDCEPDSSWDEYRVQVSRGLRAATALVAPSLAMLQSVLGEYGVTTDKALCIANFTRAERRSTRGTPSNEAFVLAVGRVWDKAKNFNLLERVAPQISWPLYVAGGGETPGGGGRFRVNGVRYLGELEYPKLIERVEAASIFVHPALYEPFGLAVLEAAKSGCCLILADIASLRELWGDAAVFLDPRDEEAWVETLRELIANRAKRSLLSERAYVAAQRYSAGESVRLYRELYDRLSLGTFAGGGAAA